jgi:YD repeat-containing protein
VIENYQAGIPADSETNVRTEYTYDENGDRLSILDGNGHLTTFTYDALNRLLTETDPLNHTWTYAYDDVGNRISMTDANGAVTNYVYDDAGRLTTIDYPGTSIDVSFTYDNGGRRLTMTDGLGTTTWTYDARNQVTTITDPFNKTVDYAYDAAGNRTAITYLCGQWNRWWSPGPLITHMIPSTVSPRRITQPVISIITPTTRLGIGLPKKPTLKHTPTCTIPPTA